MNETQCAELIVIIRPSFKKLCGPDACRAALYNHILFRLAGKAKSEATTKVKKGEIFWFASAEDICKDMDDNWSVNKVRKEIKALVESGLVGQRHNPAKGWDRKFQYFVGDEQGKALLKRTQSENVCLLHIGLNAEVLHLLHLVNAFNKNGGCICQKEEMDLPNLGDASTKFGGAIPKGITKGSTETSIQESAYSETGQVDQQDASASQTHAQFAYQIEGYSQFYYHDYCNHAQDRGCNDGLTFIVKNLSDVPQDAECQICYKPVHGAHGYGELHTAQSEDVPYVPDNLLSREIVQMSPVVDAMISEVESRIVKVSTSEEKDMYSTAITEGSIIIHKNDPDERRTGKVQSIDETGKQALILWFGTHVPHWSSLDEIILFSEWRVEHPAQPRHNPDGLPGRKPYPKLTQPEVAPAQAQGYTQASAKAEVATLTAAVQPQQSAKLAPKSTVVDIKKITLEAHTTYVFRWLDAIWQELARNERKSYVQNKTSKALITDLITACWNTDKELTEENVRAAWSEMWNSPVGPTGWSWKGKITIASFNKHYGDYLERSRDKVVAPTSNSNVSQSRPVVAGEPQIRRARNFTHAFDHIEGDYDEEPMVARAGRKS